MKTGVNSYPLILKEIHLRNKGETIKILIFLIFHSNKPFGMKDFSSV